MKMTSFYPSWWRKHFLGVGLAVAMIITALLVYWWRSLGGASVLNGLVHGNRAAIYGTLASIFGSLLGFIITALSVVLSVSSSERLMVLRESTYYPQLWAVFTSAIRVLGMTTVFWLTALFLDRDAKTRPIILVVCLGASTLAVLRIARCVWVLQRIVEVLTVKLPDVKPADQTHVS
jgi:hypothetical protein